MSKFIESGLLNGGGIEKLISIVKDKVHFSTTHLGSLTSIKLADFHLPFPSMEITLGTPYRLNNYVISKLWVSVGLYENTYQIILKNVPFSLGVTFLDSGELTLDKVKYEDQDKILALDLVVGELLVSYQEKELYRFAYEVLATIDYINTSEYIVTEHTTCKSTGEKLSKGVIERRIKIRHTKNRIKNNSESTQKRTSPRYKFRVRGHWREMESGKKVWVKDYVKGGDGTIFIPKEYEF